MATTDSYHSSINWNLLLRQLTASAATWFLEEGCKNADDILPATGKSAKELVFDAVLEFSEGKVDWKPKSLETAHGELYWLLRRVIRNDFLDLVKNGRAYKRTNVLDTHRGTDAQVNQSISKPTLDELPDDKSKIEYTIDAVILSRCVLPLIAGEKELEDYVNAVLQAGCYKREDIAAYLNIPPQEVTNRQRTLRLRLASWKRKQDSNVDGREVKYEK